MSQNNAPVVQPDNTSGEQPDNTDKVPSYESYQKLLGEKKRAAETAKELQAKIDELTANQRAQEEDRLKANKQWKEAYESAKKDLQGKINELNTSAQERLQAKQMKSILDAVPGELPRKYWDLVDLEKVPMEGDIVDEFSVSKYVEEFTKSFPEIIKPKESRRMPTDTAPADSGGKLTYEQWQALPLKEKQLRIKDVN